MGLRERLQKAQGTTMQVAVNDSTGRALASSWVARAQEGARIGQPVTDKGLPVRVVGGGLR